MPQIFLVALCYEINLEMEGLGTELVNSELYNELVFMT